MGDIIKKFFVIFFLLNSLCFADNILITEFMAKNDSSLTNETGNTYDWIEIYNPGSNDVNLGGWFLTDDAAVFSKWMFPATNINAKSYLLIFASDQNKSFPGEELHTNFKLSSAGEFLALIKSDSNTISFAYSPIFPQQISDVSCGLPAASTYEELLITSAAPCKAFVPTDSSLSLSWTEKSFVDSSWSTGTTGVGYDNNPTYLPLIGLDVKAEMSGINASCYVRVPFVVDNVSELSSMTLRMKYDDGFVAYINGEEIASANAPPGTLAWNAQATGLHDDTLATTFIDYSIPFISSIINGTNVLSIHGLNYPSTSSDALFLPELSASFSSGYITNKIAYFFTPTPGAANNAGISNLPPIISFAGHSPLVPEDFEDITVTARITETSLPVGNVRLHYRVMYGSEVIVSMTDIGNGIYSGNISSAVSFPGNMVRYYITASDTSGSTLRWPLFATSTDTEYLGTIINNPLINTNIPVYHWFVLNTGAAETRTGTRCSFFYNGEFYDNIFCRVRGGSSVYVGAPKFPHKFEFNADHEFKFSEKYKRADEINVLAAYNDTSYMRDFLSWEILKDSSLPYCFAEIIQMRQNGVFFGLEVCVEQVDGHFLRRQNINDNGSLYKSPHPGTLIELSTMGFLEKKRPADGDFSDMTNFINGLHLPTEAQIKTYMLDNVNIPEVVNYLAAHRIFMEFDFTSKNYYLYNDSEERGEWTIYAWDKDLTFGMIWGGTYVFGNNDYAYSSSGRGVASMYWSEANYLYRRIIGTFRDMYARRIRTLMDKLLQPPDTPRENLKFENRVYELHGKIKALADLDRAKWGWPSNTAFYARTDHLDIDGGCNELTNNFFAQRRTHLYITHNVDNGGMIPHGQPETANLIFGNIEIFPSSGIKDEEYFELINTNNFAVDISCWQISNAVTFTFFGGTVIPAGEKAYVSPNIKALRARSVSPKSGENNFVVGNYSGRLDANGETIFLLNCEGDIIASANTIPEPFLFIIYYLLFIIYWRKFKSKI